MKKLISLITIFGLFLTLFVIKPITLKAATETPEISSNQAVDTNSQQLLDGTGYFKKTDTATQYEFYYTTYLDVAVDYSTNESLYVRKINRSVVPSEWYNLSYGLDLDNFESVSIIQGKWALPYEYARDEKGNIIPESTGYLEESIYSDCRRYVYYLVYVNEDGVQRPKYDKHYECDVETSSIPSYLLNNGKNEKMGIHNGKIYDTQLIMINAIKNIIYYEEVHYGSLDLNNDFDDKYLFPIIYFNISDVDYDELLSVNFSYVVLEHEKNFWGNYTEKILKSYPIADTVYFDEVLNYNEKYKTFWDYIAMIGTSSETIAYRDFLEFSESLNSSILGDSSTRYKALESGVWNFDDCVLSDSKGNILYNQEMTFKNRIVGHLTDLKLDKNSKRNQYVLEQKSVKFLSVSYVYNGILYKSDDNVIINSTDVTPEDKFDEDIWSTFLNKLMQELGKMPAQIVDAANDGLIASLTSFWTNLSLRSKNIILFIVLIFVLSITSGWWLPLLRALIYRNNQKAYDESLKISSRKAYNKQHRRERKELKEDRKYETRTSIMNKAFEIDSRNYQSKEADKERKHWNDHYESKYAHEQSLQDKRNVSFEQQRQHEVYMSEHQSKEAEKNRKFLNKQNKAKNEAAERKYKENSLWRKYWNKSNKEKYAHEERIQTNQLKENEANRKYWKNKNKQSSNKKTVKKTTGNKMDPDVIEALRNMKIKKPWE